MQSLLHGQQTGLFGHTMSMYSTIPSYHDITKTNHSATSKRSGRYLVRLVVRVGDGIRSAGLIHIRYDNVGWVS